MYNYWSCDPDVLTVEINKDDHTAICGQFDSGVDTTVTNLMIYLHNYQQYNTDFKCPIKLTSAVGTNNIHPL